MEELQPYLHDKRTQVDHHLRESLRLAEPCPPTLMEAIRYSLLAPGKRLRPLLVILAAEACGGTEVVALPAGCAVEMVHTYSLIHDDLPAMDDDDLRRGLPTCHRKFGEAMAILAGDALLTLAFQVLATYPAATAAACCRELAVGAGAAGMVGGQVEDLAWEEKPEAEPGNEEPRTENRERKSALSRERPDHSRFSVLGSSLPGSSSPTLEALQGIHARKTGALFRASLRMGVQVAQAERPGGAEPATLECFDAYGRCFGQLFQITDDLLDVEGNAEHTGKRVQKDANRGKLTYPSFLGIEESRRRAEQLCRLACEHVRPLGAKGQRLTALVQMVLERDR